MQPQVEQEPKLVTSEICHASHMERATKVFPSESAFPSPATSPFSHQQQRISAKVGTWPRQQTAPLILGFCKISQQRTSLSRTPPVQRGDSPDELIVGALRILGPDPHLCGGYSYSYCLGLDDKHLVEETNQHCSRALTVALEVTAAVAFTVRGEQLLAPKGGRNQGTTLPTAQAACSYRRDFQQRLACKEEQGNHQTSSCLALSSASSSRDCHLGCENNLTSFSRV